MAPPTAASAAGVVPTAAYAINTFLDFWIAGHSDNRDWTCP